ncbi:hypothetical protein PVAND_001272 [Polypedilum vanderplanki]|uniref:Uncharacterized protein n=1 Tax=Polypedilum vanderplanki TaxID=319348 RepID=A0A9J6BNR4_POLVA|nr:hypothetical protein PVAND_001272 [Polypedilum vanderplanki]
MNTVLIVLSCIIAVTLAQSCNNCGPPQDPVSPCGVPDCSLPENHQNHALFPHPDPNFYYQCYPHNIAQGWQPIVRQCACGTVFNPHIHPRRCTFWWESTWFPICNWQSPPVLAPCPPWCPDCEGNGTPPPLDPPVTPAPPVTPPPINPPPGEPPCVCPPPDNCPPCVWWPCVPCVPPPCFCGNNNNRIG